jgi:hypothetical protein
MLGRCEWIELADGWVDGFSTPVFYLKIRRFREWILSPYSGKTFSDGHPIKDLVSGSGDGD